MKTVAGGHACLAVPVLAAYGTACPLGEGLLVPMGAWGSLGQHLGQGHGRA